MNEKVFAAAFREFAVLDVTGDDAGQILHNVTTNDVRKLEPGEGIETCLTDVRGKVLGHGWMFRLADRFRFLGAAGQSETLASHIDRYTIREDATPHVRDADWHVVATHTSDEKSALPSRIVAADDVYVPATFSGSLQFRLMAAKARSDGSDQSPSAATMSAATPSAEPMTLEPMTAEQFHDLRVERFCPWYGIDVTEANLPQELARDSAAISFTKGCYLGQETVARLDALGQVQKKLVRLVDIEGDHRVGTVIHSDGKPVARLTSVHSSGRSALAMVRRAWFEDGLSVRGDAVPPDLPPAADASPSSGTRPFAARVASASEPAAG